MCIAHTHAAGHHALVAYPKKSIWIRRSQKEEKCGI